MKIRAEKLILSYEEWKKTADEEAVKRLEKGVNPVSEEGVNLVKASKLETGKLRISAAVLGKKILDGDENG